MEDEKEQLTWKPSVSALGSLIEIWSAVGSTNRVKVAWETWF